MYRWVDEIRYLGVFIIRGAKFKTNVLSTKLSGLSILQQMVYLPKSASEEVMVQLLKQKMFAYFTVCSRCMQLGQKINAVTGLYIQ